MMNDIDRLRALRYGYYHGIQILDDFQYDSLEKEAKNANPNDPFFNEVGSNPNPDQFVIDNYNKLLDFARNHFNHRMPHLYNPNKDNH